jgi:autotransporter passenger strand-loop-strand repeat protein
MATITVTAGQNVSVGSGRTDNGDTVDSGGTLHILSGGVVENTDDQGIVFVSAGGTAIFSFLENGSLQEVFGIASDTLIVKNSQEAIVSGGTAIRTTVASGATQEIFDEGTAIGTIVSSGGVQQVFGGIAIGAILRGGGTQFLNLGGVADGTVVDSGGIQFDTSLANGTVVNIGGQQNVLGGTSLAAVVNGDQLVDGGTASGTIVNSAGTEAVTDGGIATGTVVNSGGEQTISDFSLASATVVNGGGRQDVYDDAQAVNTVVNSGGEQELHDYASATGTIVSGGEQIVADYANASSTEVRSGGVQVVEDYATASATAIDTGGTQIVENSALAVETTVSSGGALHILNGATAESPHLMSGGTIFVGGTLLINSETVSAISGGIVLTPGGQVDLEEGIVSGVLDIVKGAALNTISGFSNTVIAPTAKAIVNAGVFEVTSETALTLSGTVSNTGTLLVDDQGGLVIAGTLTGGVTSLVNGGAVRIEQASSENVVFQAGGADLSTLLLDAANTYSGRVSGFGTNDSIAFLHINSAGASIVYTPNASSPTTSGVLTVDSGGKAVAKITMIGDFTTPDFLPGNDGMGHLFIFDPRVVEQKGNAPAVIAADTVLEVKAADSGEVTFAGPTGTLWLDHPGTFTGKVADFGAQEGPRSAGHRIRRPHDARLYAKQERHRRRIDGQEPDGGCEGRPARQLHRDELRRRRRRPRRHLDHREPADGGLASAAGQAALNGAAARIRRSAAARASAVISAPASMRAISSRRRSAASSVTRVATRRPLASASLAMR